MRKHLELKIHQKKIWGYLTSPWQMAYSRKRNQTLQEWGRTVQKCALRWPKGYQVCYKTKAEILWKKNLNSLRFISQKKRAEEFCKTLIFERLNFFIIPKYYTAFLYDSNKDWSFEKILRQFFSWEKISENLRNFFSQNISPSCNRGK